MKKNLDSYSETLFHLINFRNNQYKDSKSMIGIDYDSFIIKGSLNKVIKELPRSEILRENLKFFDWKKIDYLIEDTINGKKSGGKFLFTLLSINNFLNNLEN